MPPIIRPATISDLSTLADMCFDLWPDGPRAEHESEQRDLLEGKPVSTLPLTVFVAELDGAVVGFIQVGLRSHADGCDMTHAVGFIEGWYVSPDHRHTGIGTQLMQAAENWSRSQGCKEIASDTWADNKASQDAHVALGFELGETVVNFKKNL